MVVAAALLVVFNGSAEEDVDEQLLVVEELDVDVSGIETVMVST